MSISRWLIPVAMVGSLGLALPALAGDPQHGLIVSARCAACHGARGETDDPMFPKLAGQNGGYLFMQLKYFKEGVRTNGLMTPIAAALTTQDMDDVAAFFAEIGAKQGQAVQPPQVVQPSGQQQQAATQQGGH